MTIWLTSDLHFCHDRDFIYKPRGFSNVDEMNEAIVQNWNDIVDDEDEVYCLGDIMLNNNEKGMELWNRLKGKKHVIFGNHDSKERRILYSEAPNTEIHGCAMTLRYKGYHLYLSHYPTLTSNYDENYPIRKKVICLCGHVHTQNPYIDLDKGLIYHVELDAHDNKPIALDKVIEDIEGVFLW